MREAHTLLVITPVLKLTIFKPNQSIGLMFICHSIPAPGSAHAGQSRGSTEPAFQIQHIIPGLGLQHRVVFTEEELIAAWNLYARDVGVIMS